MTQLPRPSQQSQLSQLSQLSQPVLDYYAMQDYEAFVLECNNDPQEAWALLDVIQTNLARPRLSSE